MSGDLARLPKWAQRRIESAERDRDHWQRRALEGPPNSDTFLSDLMELKPLGIGETIAFTFDDRRDGRIDVRLDREAQRLYVMSAGKALHVIPQASNALRIALGDY